MAGKSQKKVSFADSKQIRLFSDAEKAVREIASAFDLASTAKDKFALNVSQKMPIAARQIRDVANAAKELSKAMGDVGKVSAAVERVKRTGTATVRSNRVDPMAARMSRGTTGDYMGVARKMSAGASSPLPLPAGYGGPSDAVLRQQFSQLRLKELRKFRAQIELAGGSNPPMGGGGFLSGTGYSMGSRRRAMGGAGIPHQFDQPQGPYGPFQQPASPTMRGRMRYTGGAGIPHQFDQPQGPYGPFQQPASPTMRGRMRYTGGAGIPVTPSVTGSGFGTASTMGGTRRSTGGPSLPNGRSPEYADAVNKLSSGRGLYGVSRDLMPTELKQAYADAEKRITKDITAAEKRASVAPKGSDAASIANEEVQVLKARLNMNRAQSTKLKEKWEARLKAEQKLVEAIEKDNKQSTIKSRFDVQSARSQFQQKNREYEATRNPHAATQGMGGQNLTFAAGQLAYGVEDFFQVLAAGQSPLRAFLGAANNIGPALALAGISATTASFGVAALLGVSALFAKDSKKAKDRTDEWKESLDRLGESLKSAAQQQAEFANERAKAAGGVSSNGSVDRLRRLGVVEDVSSSGQKMIREGMRVDYKTQDFEKNEWAVGKASRNLGQNFNDLWDRISTDFRFAEERPNKNESDRLKPVTFEQLLGMKGGQIEKSVGKLPRTQQREAFVAGMQGSRMLLDEQNTDESAAATKKQLDLISSTRDRKDRVGRERQELSSEIKSIINGLSVAIKSEQETGVRGGASAYAEKEAGKLLQYSQLGKEAEAKAKEYQKTSMGSSYKAIESQIAGLETRASRIEKAGFSGSEKLEFSRRGKAAFPEAAAESLRNEARKLKAAIAPIAIQLEALRDVAKAFKEAEDGLRGVGNGAIAAAANFAIAESQFNSPQQQSVRESRGGMPENNLFGGVVGRQINMNEALLTLGEQLSFSIAKLTAEIVDPIEREVAIAARRQQATREKLQILQQGAGFQFDERGLSRILRELNDAAVGQMKRGGGNPEQMAAVGMRAGQERIGMLQSDPVNQAKQSLNEFSNALLTAKTQLNVIARANKNTEKPLSDLEVNALAVSSVMKQLGFEVKKLPDRLKDLDDRASQTLKMIDSMRLPTGESGRLKDQVRAQTDAERAAAKFNDPAAASIRNSRGGYSDRLRYKTPDGMKNGQQMNFESQLKTMREQFDVEKKEMKAKGGPDVDQALSDMESSFRRKVASLMDQSFGLSEKKNAKVMPANDMWKTIQEGLNSNPTLKVEQSQLDMLKKIHDALMKGDTSKLSEKEKRAAENIVNGGGVRLSDSSGKIRAGGSINPRFGGVKQIGGDGAAMAEISPVDRKAKNIERSDRLKRDAEARKEGFRDEADRQSKFADPEFAKNRLEGRRSALESQEADLSAQEEWAPAIGGGGSSLKKKNGKSSEVFPAGAMLPQGDMSLSLKDSLDQSKVLSDIASTLKTMLGQTSGGFAEMVTAVEGIQSGLV